MPLWVSGKRIFAVINEKPTLMENNVHNFDDEGNELESKQKIFIQMLKNAK